MKFNIFRVILALSFVFFAFCPLFALGVQDTSLENAQQVLLAMASPKETRSEPIPSVQSGTNSGAGGDIAATESGAASGGNSKASTAASVITSVLTGVTGAGEGLSFSNDEAVQALKTALKTGAETASKQLNIEDAYYRNPLYYIDLPPDAEKLVATVVKLPNGKKTVENVILRLNRTAEACAAGIIPIFTEAVTGMSVADGVGIVTGEENAATEYLKGKTYTQLVALYKPQVAAALDQRLVGDMSANEAWSKLVSLYNKAGSGANKIGSIFGKDEVMQTVDTDLAAYATEKALNAIFLKIADEEREIRRNPMEYSSNIIRKVFGSLGRE